MARAHALIIEDSSTARILLSRMLERADISSRGVASAEEAFPLLQSEPFDLIFLDHLLPGMDGFEALKKLKSDAETRDIPVFMYTSQNAEKYIQEARALGANGVIRKQVDREQLITTLDQILREPPESGESLALRAAVEGAEQGARESLEQASRRITGRLSTVEVAYEELEEDVRELRTAVNTLRNQRIEDAARSRFRIRLLCVSLLAVVAVLALLVFWQISLLGSHIEQADGQFELLRGVVRGLVELVGE
ncbi:response regulator [Marinobacter salinexigens]|uniref:Response regulator n=1 Tax=Marinobacter salinexigens TaxID=2919747 RepID=A0A5B0VI89_9GAMM|nr:response regulator [Marinobacter salinexigens]KAA1173691.1 response regulator [Marinobacter salinexigens]